MSGFPRPWALAGGWAADAWLGHQTRDHGDVDITVFHDDQRALFEHLAAWNMVAHDPPIAGGGSNTNQWEGRHLTLPAHVHARPPGTEIPAGWPVSGTPADGLNLEVILDRRKDDEWWLHDDPRIAVPVCDSIQMSSGDVPTLTPEIVMFFKATAYSDDPRFPRPRDVSDFLGLLPLLDEGRREWLHEAIALRQPAHPWIPLLSA